MGNRHGAFEVVQETFQPRNRFGIRGWWVRRAAACPALRNRRHSADATAPPPDSFSTLAFQSGRRRASAALAVRSSYDRRALDNLFKPALACGQLVEVGIRTAYSAYTSSRRLSVNHFRNGLQSTPRTVCVPGLAEVPAAGSQS